MTNRLSFFLSRFLPDSYRCKVRDRFSAYTTCLIRIEHLSGDRKCWTKISDFFYSAIILVSDVRESSSWDGYVCLGRFVSSMWSASDLVACAVVSNFLRKIGASVCIYMFLLWRKFRSFERNKLLRHLLRRLAMPKVASPKRLTNIRRPRTDFTGEEVLISRKHQERGKKFFRFWGVYEYTYPLPPF